MNKSHQKHAKLPRPLLGDWGRSELALLGAPCNVINEFADNAIKYLSAKLKVAFVDADHHSDSNKDPLTNPVLHFTDKISFKRIDYCSTLTTFDSHLLFNNCDLILVNGNHFPAKHQIVFIDPAKPLAAKLELLTSVKLVVLKDKTTTIPDYLQPIINEAPVLVLNDTAGIHHFLERYIQNQIPGLNGLVLTGGKSERMGTDKSLLKYHGITQREYAYTLLQQLCNEVYLSCNAEQSTDIVLPKIEDRFLGIGPLGGILSAFQSAPDNAWLTLACDIPYLSQSTLNYLVQHRNPYKLATAFFDATGQFPEPLITIWEPRAYPVLLQALGQGYSCPRKVLINSDVALLHAPDALELQNVNDTAAHTKALKDISLSHQLSTGDTEHSQ